MARIIVFVLTALACAPVARACTTLCFNHDGALVFARNYDWNIGMGHVIVNKRGVRKATTQSETSARWVSRFGSVTFNQYGRGIPCGGMNEAGLVVELMWLDDTRYPDADARPEVSKLGWIQYQLDTAESVEDVIASDVKIRVASGGAARVHYLVADRTGHVAAIEFLDGRMVVHTGDDMPYRALTNDTYERSAGYAARVIDGDNAGDASGTSSLNRFVRAAVAADRYTEAAGDPVAYAFDVLDNVSQGARTQWRIVYDMPARRVYFEARPRRERRFLDFGEIDFSCAMPAQYVDMNNGSSGDVMPQLAAHSLDENYNLIRAAVRGTSFLRDVEDASIRALAATPDNYVCEVDQ